MRLEDKYYQIEDCRSDDGHTVFAIRLLPECDVYVGHFPGNPVCPGVCHIEMLRECVVRLTGKKLFISSIRQCRLTSVASPGTCNRMELTVSLKDMSDGGVAVTATLADADKTYMEYRGDMTVSL